jgi:RNA polymerase sigma factor (sigma-70 family)
VRPITDDLWLEQFQFVQLAIQRAIARGRPFDQAKVIEHARIDWARRQKAERKRQRKTRRIDDLIEEPASPSRQAAIDAKIDASRMLEELTQREHSMIALLFLSGYSRSEVAHTLGVAIRTVDKTRQSALDKMRMAHF